MTDPIMNPGAPSGRRDDSSLTSIGKRIALAAGTRLYTDAGGVKHYIQPDGTTRMVPPGEVGNFYIEGEDPQMALRRYLIQKLPYVDAVRVGSNMDNLFGALDEMRKAGAAFKLVPLNAEEDPEMSDLLEKAYMGSEPAQYPKAKYHQDGSYRAVADEDEEGELGDGWHDHPDDAKKAAGPDEQSGSLARKQAEGDDARLRSQNDSFVGESGFSDTGGVIKPDVAKGDKPAPVA